MLAQALGLWYGISRNRASAYMRGEADDEACLPRWRVALDPAVRTLWRESDQADIVRAPTSTSHTDDASHLTLGSYDRSAHHKRPHSRLRISPVSARAEMRQHAIPAAMAPG